MNLDEYRASFTVFLCVADLELSSELRSHLSGLGYETYSFLDIKTAKDRFKEARPHILIFHLDDIRDSVEAFLRDIRASAPELLIIGIGDLSQRLFMSRYFEFGVHDLVAKGDGLIEDIQWSTDRAAELLLYIYQNEQLLEEVNALSHSSGVDHLEPAASPKTSQVSSSEEMQAGRLLAAVERANLAFNKCQDEAELVEALMIHLGQNLGENGSFLYFRFVPQAYSFVVSRFEGQFPDDTIGVGFKLTPEESKDFDAWVRHPTELASLRELMTAAFDKREFDADCIRVNGVVTSLLVRTHPLDIPLELQPYWRMVVSFFQQKLEHFHFKNLSFRSEARDPLTQLYSVEQFKIKLEEEIARSRRLKMPVCVIHGQVDDPDRFRSQFQEQEYENCVKTLAGIIQRTSRVNDIVFRTGELKFSLILAHCARKGAAIRAERLRRIIESTPFSSAAVHVTFTLGVAEYPSHALSADELSQIATFALNQVQARGGNKVCLATPPPGFQADFDVPEL